MANNVDIDTYKCPICCDIYEDPVIVSCGNKHVVCNGCLSASLAMSEPKCAVCRSDFDPKKVLRDRTLQRRMRSINIPCFGCQEEMAVIHMKKHLTTCSKIDRHINYFKPVKETTQYVPKNLPNRSTFQCPYCGQQNLDSCNLLKHCNKDHQHDTESVVCPICASMPWGDREQRSADFLHHLNIRHKFEYDTYVDFGQDDDAMLQAALQASLQKS